MDKPQLQTRPIGELRNWEKNPRNITDRDFKRLKEQIKLGQYKPLLVTSDGIVLGGNMRLRAFQQLGVKDVWVSTVEFIPDDDKFLAVVNGETQTTRKFNSIEEGMLEYSMSDNDRAGFYDNDNMANLVGQFPSIDWKGYAVEFDMPETLAEMGLIENEIDKTMEEVGDKPKYPLVPKFSEKYDAIIIVSENEIDTANVLETLGLGTSKSYKGKETGKSFVISAKDFQARCQKIPQS